MAAGAVGAAAVLSSALPPVKAAPVSGSGTVGKLPKWTGTTTIGDSLVFDTGAAIRPDTNRAKDLGFISTTDTTENVWKNVIGQMPIFVGEHWTPYDTVPNWTTGTGSFGTSTSAGGTRLGEVSAAAANSFLSKTPNIGGLGTVGHFDFSKDFVIAAKVRLDFTTTPTAQNTQAGVLAISSNVDSELSSGSDKVVYIVCVVNPNGTIEYQAVHLNVGGANVGVILLDTNLPSGTGGRPW